MPAPRSLSRHPPRVSCAEPNAAPQLSKRPPGPRPAAQYSRLDDSEQSIWLNSYKDDGGVPFGSARVSIDPDCPLENLVLPYLTGGKGLPEPVTILWVGDSLDAQARKPPCPAPIHQILTARRRLRCVLPPHPASAADELFRVRCPPTFQLLDYVCIDYVRRGGSSGWFAFLRNHIQVNYCHLPNGLTLVQARAIELSFLFFSLSRPRLALPPCWRAHAPDVLSAHAPGRGGHHPPLRRSTRSGTTGATTRRLSGS